MLFRALQHESIKYIYKNMDFRRPMNYVVCGLGVNCIYFLILRIPLRLCLHCCLFRAFNERQSLINVLRQCIEMLIFHCFKCLTLTQTGSRII